MFCPTCGAQIPDDSVFCRNCGAPIPGRQTPNGTTREPRAEKVKTTPAIFTNLLNTVKAFFSKKPEEGIHVAGESNTFEWSILLGLNVLVFAFAFAINVRQIVSGFTDVIGSTLQGSLQSSMGSLGSLLGGYNLSSELTGFIANFGFFLLFGILISLFANAIVFGVYFLLEKVIHRGNQSFMGTLNTVAYSTIPVTLVCTLNMLIGIIWGVLVIPFFVTAVVAQIFLLYIALKHNAKENRVSFLISIGVCCSALVLIFVIGYLLFSAGVSASTSVAMRNLSSNMSYYGW